MTTTHTITTLRDQAEALLTRLSSDVEDHFDVNRFVRRLLAKYHKIAAIWSIEDVQGIRPHLTANQAWEVLEQVRDHHDAEWGISWTTLETVADDLFPAPETDDAGEKQP